MVTFTCMQCQWTGKKKQVEKHYNRCGGEYFSCIDCGKEFAEDYAKHIACIDEEDKYHGKWAKSKKKQNNRTNHQQMLKNKQTNQKQNGLTQSSNDKKRKRDTNEQPATSLPPTKKQKVDTIQPQTPKQNKKKTLKRILKNKQDMSLKIVCS
eukprot:202056_1